MFVAHSARRCAAARSRWGIFTFLLGMIWMGAQGARAAEIALTIQESSQRTGALFQSAQRAHRIVRSLRDVGLGKALFFVSTAIPNVQSQHLAVYTAAGHGVGNYTHSRLDLDRASSELFWQDVLTAHHALVSAAGFAPWFRYPQFHEGADATCRDRVRAELAAMGYRNAYVTIDHRDEYMDALLQGAVKEGRKVDRAALRAVYLDTMISGIEFYDNLSRTTLGRSVRHVLALHENDLNALFIGDLVVALRELGHVIISPELAYEDEIARHVSPTAFSRNPGRVGEIAYDRGYTGPLWHASYATSYIDALFKSRRVFAAAPLHAAKALPRIVRKSGSKPGSSRL